MYFPAFPLNHTHRPYLFILLPFPLYFYLLPALCSHHPHPPHLFSPFNNHYADSFNFFSSHSWDILKWIILLPFKAPIFL